MFFPEQDINTTAWSVGNLFFVHVTWESELVFERMNVLNWPLCIWRLLANERGFQTGNGEEKVTNPVTEEESTKNKHEVHFTKVCAYSLSLKKTRHHEP